VRVHVDHGYDDDGRITRMVARRGDSNIRLTDHTYTYEGELGDTHGWMQDFGAERTTTSRYDPRIG
jgi:hypothetical protein